MRDDTLTTVQLASLNCRRNFDLEKVSSYYIAKETKNKKGKKTASG